MPERLLDELFARLHRIESPIVRHRELEPFSCAERADVLAAGILRSTDPALEIPKPDCHPGGGHLQVCRTSRGIFGVAGNWDDFFDPVPLVGEDVAQYEISLDGLVTQIREKNAIGGVAGRVAPGLISVGQKLVVQVGAVDVYLACPNSDEHALAHRCQSITSAAGACSVVLIPVACPVARDLGQLLAARRILLVPLQTAVRDVSFALDWQGILAGTLRSDRSDGIHSPSTVVWRGTEHQCALTSREMQFLRVGLQSAEIDIQTVMNKRNGLIWKERYQKTRVIRDKISQFLSRLNTKLTKATPPLPISFSLLRDRSSIVRSDPLPADSALTED